MKKKFKSFTKKALERWLAKLADFIRDPLFLNRWTKDSYRTPDPDRLTAWSNSGYKSPIGRDDYVGDVFMFIEDLHLQIMPLSNSLRNGATSYSAKTEPENRKEEELIAKALGREMHSRDLSDALADFIRDHIQTILTYGKIVYEVRTVKDDQGIPTEIKLYSVYPASMKKLLGTYWQTIPWSAAKHAHIKAGIRRIPANKLLWIQFPSKLGGKRKLIKILRELAFISKEVMPKFQMKLMENQKEGSFDFNKYIWDRYIYKGKITRDYGWDQRKFGNDDMLEYYSLVRLIRFAKTQAILREHILREINRMLKRPDIGCSGEIVIENLPTSEDLDAQLEILKKGDIEFKSIYNKIMVR